MWRITAVGVHDDFAAGETGIALRSAGHESTCGINVILSVLVQEIGGETVCRITCSSISDRSCSFETF